METSCVDVEEDDQMIMGDKDDCGEYHSSTQITAIPEEVLELIFSHLSPYRDLKSAMVACKQWHRVVTDLIVKLRRNFDQMLRSSQVTWQPVSSEQVHSITDRYSHSACYFEGSMYVFGGCSSTSTTFNDLWRFDLATRQWVRPLAMGTYPSPKAYASMVAYKDCLVLYGGWSRPTPMPLHQAPRYFSELHTYTPSTNRWAQIMAVSNDALHRVAGHSASILGDTMVVFGGSLDAGSGSNDVWLFDFIESVWKKPVIVGKKPNPRYGQSQTTLDDEHILIIGGCGGPNQLFSDVWLLHLNGDQGTWEEVVIENGEFSPHALWCHPPCMVDGLAVIISKNSRVKGSNVEPQPQQGRGGWVPPPGIPAPPQGLVPNGAGPPNLHPPHIPPPLPFPPMAAFQRRRDDWGGGGGGGGLGGLLGVLPPGPQEGPEVAPQHNFHGAHNPNIQDVQRLNLRNNGAHGRGGAPPRGAPPTPPHSLNLSARRPPQGSGVSDATSPQRDRVWGASPSGAEGGSGSISDDERPGPSHHHHHYHHHRDADSDDAPCHRPRAASLNSPSADSDSDSDVSAAEQDSGAHAHGPRPGFPSIRPNAMHNRQRQLDMLRKHEDRLWRSRNANNSMQRGGGGGLCGVDVAPPRNPMVLHVLDLSRVVSTRTAAWLPTRDTPIPGAPEETIFFSLVEGRGELVLFGGIRRDQNPMQRVNSPPDSGLHYVSNVLFLISPRALRPS
ncbi:uncharacterized protein LOC143287640 [Babylonia areolata]|uniref:uncharacterized protein LOC143287640 n=1 Tax=Babylonia areolata TaxID=304850 RepID=UPI003FD59B1A